MVYNNDSDSDSPLRFSMPTFTFASTHTFAYASTPSPSPTSAPTIIDATNKHHDPHPRNAKMKWRPRKSWNVDRARHIDPQTLGTGKKAKHIVFLLG